MTVRGGSAFNSLQRALKQDLLDSGAAERNPEVGPLYKLTNPVNLA